MPDFANGANALAEQVSQDAANAAAAVSALANDVWVSGTTYAIGGVVYSPTDYLNYRRITNGAGTTDPAWTGFQNEGTITNATIELDASSIVGGWLGWFPVCPSGETTSLIEWDLTTPNGFGKIKSNGSIEGRSRQVQYQIRFVGETDPVINSYFTIAGASRDQLGWSRQQVIANGRYEMRIRRIGAEDTATNSMDTINWFGLKSLLPTPTSYTGITTLALTLTGSDTIAVS